VPLTDATQDPGETARNLEPIFGFLNTGSWILR